MVFWMRRAAPALKGELHGKMQAALELGKTGVFAAALLAVGREGLETALFLYPTFQAQGAGAGPAVGALLGIVTAVLIGLLIYRGVVHMNLSMFFRLTGAALIVIAAGVLAYGVHDLQEAGILPGLRTLAWDIEGYQITSWYGTLVKGVFNLGPQMTVLEVLTYVGYLIPTVSLFLRPLHPVNADAPETAESGRAGLVPRSEGAPAVREPAL
jgi:high-affinity iron transporter